MSSLDAVIASFTMWSTLGRVEHASSMHAVPALEGGQRLGRRAIKVCSRGERERDIRRASEQDVGDENIGSMVASGQRADEGCRGFVGHRRGRTRREEQQAESHLLSLEVLE